MGADSVSRTEEPRDLIIIVRGTSVGIYLLNLLLIESPIKLT